MKKVKIKDRLNNAANAFFETNAGEDNRDLMFAGGSAVLPNDRRAMSSETAGIWATSKYFLFFLPGVALLFFVTLALTDFLIFGKEHVRDFTFAFFWLGLGAFLTMFGIGKLAELKYLKVVGSIVLASFAITLSFFFVPDELKGKFFGIYSLYFLPFVWLLAFAVKKRIDKRADKIS